MSIDQIKQNIEKLLAETREINHGLDPVFPPHIVAHLKDMGITEGYTESPSLRLGDTITWPDGTMCTVTRVIPPQKDQA